HPTDRAVGLAVIGRVWSRIDRGDRRRLVNINPGSAGGGGVVLVAGEGARGDVTAGMHGGGAVGGVVADGDRPEVLAVDAVRLARGRVGLAVVDAAEPIHHHCCGPLADVNRGGAGGRGVVLVAGESAGGSVVAGVDRSATV